MKQLLQSLRTGELKFAEVPASGAEANELLVRTHASLISPGTERMLLEFGKASLIEKARQQPDKVRMVFDKIRADGLLPAYESVRAKLDQRLAPGYCNAGTVIETGSARTGFAPGDRVVSNGPHAEVVHVPVNLCARIPDTVGDEAAAFTVLGAVALQGIRLAAPALGEMFAVTGLGLIGLLAVQLLRANGCRVLAIDFSRERLDLARAFGAETADLSRGDDAVRIAQTLSSGKGLDGVVIAASTKSDEPVHQAAAMCRQRGRIVLVGVTGMQLSRDDFYRKELTFQVSCSYGPGRYDPAYEQGGQDYPYGYVRWTAQRNFEAVLDMLAAGTLNVEPLISHTFPLERAAEAYELIENGQPALGILLRYANTAGTPRSIVLADRMQPQEPLLSCIGAGAYAMKVLFPAFRKAGAAFETVVSKGGVSAAHAGTKFGFREASTDPERVLFSEAGTIVIATPHDSHARFVCAALEAGKNVFVEKPLAVSPEEVDQITWAARRGAPLLMVGFNRRFSPHSRKIKELLCCRREPLSIIVTVNAGRLPGEERIVGEGCHFVDLLRFLTGQPVTTVQSTRHHGSASFTLGFKDDSTGTVHYLVNGHRSFPKERVEIFCGGRILRLDNFHSLTGWGWPGFYRMTYWRQNKGAREMAAAFMDAVRSGGPSPIPLEEILEVARVTLEVAQC